MDERDLKIQKLTQDVAKWKNRAVEVAQVACENCEEYAEGHKNCGACRVLKIKEEAGRS